jgi:NADPH:quinone reductase-like Zn-dependent oxidoreductase
MFAAVFALQRAISCRSALSGFGVVAYRSMPTSPTRKAPGRRARSSSPSATEAAANRSPVRQWRITAGDIQHLALREVPALEAPRNHQVTIDVKACGLNFADVFACLGLYSATPSGEFTPGLEFSGLVIAKGGGVTGLAVGDRVFGVTRFGGYATRINIDAMYCRELPSDWTFEEGAAYPAQALTAYYGLVKLGGVEKGQKVLVHSVAGGTGLWAAKICRALGAHVVGTVGSQSKIGVATKETGLDSAAIVDRSRHGSATAREAALTRAVSTYGTFKFDVVFDSLMGDWFDASHATLGKMGRHVVLGAGSMTPVGDKLGIVDWLRLGWQYLHRPKMDPLNMISENKSVMAFNLIWLYENTAMVGPIFDELDKVTKDLGKPLIGDVFAFDHAPAALRRLQSGETVGKVVLKV